MAKVLRQTVSGVYLLAGAAALSGRAAWEHYMWANGVFEYRDPAGTHMPVLELDFALSSTTRRAAILA